MGMESKKQTAVEWLGEQILVRRNGIDNSIPIAELFNQAKEMEKQQKAITWNNAIDAELKEKWESFEEFYNETFKSE